MIWADCLVSSHIKFLATMFDFFFSFQTFLKKGTKTELISFPTVAVSGTAGSAPNSFDFVPAEIMSTSNESQRAMSFRPPVSGRSSLSTMRRQQQLRLQQAGADLTMGSSRNRIPSSSSLMARQQQLLLQQQQLQQQQQLLEQQTFQGAYGNQLMSTMLDPQDFSFLSGQNLLPGMRNDTIGLSRGMGRTFSGQRSDPGPRMNRLADVEFTEQERYFPLYRSLPDIGYSESSNHSAFSVDPFSDREQFEKLCNSLPNLGHQMPSQGVGSHLQGLNESPYNQLHPHQQLLRDLSSDRHDTIDVNLRGNAPEKIMVNVSASMHSDLMVDQKQQSQRRKSPMSAGFGGVVEFDFNEMKLPALKKDILSNANVSSGPAGTFRPKLSTLGEGSGNNEHSSGSSSPSSKQRSKDFLECFGKIADHSNTEDNPFEPIPISTHTQSVMRLHQNIHDGVEVEEEQGGLEDMQGLEFHVA